MRWAWVVIPLVLFSIIGISESFAQDFGIILSPKHQLESGITPENIQCREDRVLVLRTNGNSACVFEKTAEKMNWKIIQKNIQEEIPTFEANESKIPIKISDERIITHSTSIQAQDIVSAIGGCPTNWPVYSVDTPSQVAIGEEFDIIIDYSYAIPDVDAGYEDPDEIFEPEKYHELCLRSEIEIRTPSFVKIIDQRYVQKWAIERWNTSPPVLGSEGFIPYDFDNTGPQQEIIIMRIDQPRFGDQLAEIYITPGYTMGITRTIVTHNGIVDLIETATEWPTWSVDDYEQHKSMLENIRSTFEISEPIQIHNQTWIDQIKPDLGYNPQPPQGNPPDMDEYASWLLQLPFPNEMRYTHIMSTGLPQYFLDDLFTAYPELLPVSLPPLSDTTQMDEFVEFLLEKYPNENYREFLTNQNFTQEYIDHLFAKYPKLKS